MVFSGEGCCVPTPARFAATGRCRGKKRDGEEDDGTVSFRRGYIMPTQGPHLSFTLLYIFVRDTLIFLDSVISVPVLLCSLSTLFRLS